MSTKSLRNAQVREVIIYEELIGGNNHEDPYRVLTVIREKDGTFIAERDPLDEMKD